VIDPDRLVTNSLAPSVHIESVLADGVLLRRDPASEQRIHIPPGKARLQIAYTGLSYVAPERVRFRFWLEGLDDHWIEAGTRRTAYFNRLPPGEYCFHVMACNNDGIWNKTGASLALIVNPFWWQTLTFRALLMAGLAGAGTITVLMPHLRRLRHALNLAEQHNMQVRVAGLGAANHQLKARSEELASALANVKILRGLLPICSRCKKIRDDKGYWNLVEKYLSQRTDAEFTHSICPECSRHIINEVRSPSEPPTR
jgi:hypothetical protein